MTTEPRRPFAGDSRRMPEFGRLTAHGVVCSGWKCRWCGRTLQQDGAAVICSECDRSNG